MTIRVGFTGEGEINALRELVHQVILSCELYPLDSRERMAATFADIPAWVAQDRYSVLGAWDGEVPVGFAISVVECGVCAVYWVGTHPDRRRRGTGLALIHLLQSTLAVRGAHRLEAYVLTSNAASQALMAKGGLRIAATLPDHFDRLDWLVYTWARSLAPTPTRCATVAAARGDTTGAGEPHHGAPPSASGL